MKKILYGKIDIDAPLKIEGKVSQSIIYFIIFKLS